VVRQVAYADGFLECVDDLTEGENRKQVKKKLVVIIDYPMSVGRPTTNPTGCRHVDVCRGQLVVLWRYDQTRDTVHFLRFGKHKRVFR
jgi:hypothetical protein